MTEHNKFSKVNRTIMILISRFSNIRNEQNEKIEFVQLTEYRKDVKQICRRVLRAKLRVNYRTIVVEK